MKSNFWILLVPVFFAGCGKSDLQSKYDALEKWKEDERKKAESNTATKLIEAEAEMKKTQKELDEMKEKERLREIEKEALDRVKKDLKKQQETLDAQKAGHDKREAVIKAREDALTKKGGEDFLKKLEELLMKVDKLKKEVKMLESKKKEGYISGSFAANLQEAVIDADEELELVRLRFEFDGRRDFLMNGNSQGVENRKAKRIALYRRHVLYRHHRVENAAKGLPSQIARPPLPSSIPIPNERASAMFRGGDWVDPSWALKKTRPKL